MFICAMQLPSLKLNSIHLHPCFAATISTKMYQTIISLAAFVSNSIFYAWQEYLHVFCIDFRQDCLLGDERVPPDWPRHTAPKKRTKWLRSLLHGRLLLSSATVHPIIVRSSPRHQSRQCITVWTSSGHTPASARLGPALCCDGGMAWQGGRPL